MEQFSDGGPDLLTLMNESCEAEGEFSVNFHDFFLKLNFDIHIKNAFDLLAWSSIFIIIPSFRFILSKSFLWGLTFLVFITRASAMLADKNKSWKILFFYFHSCALKMIPSWSSTFVLVIAKNPLRTRDNLPTDAFVFFFDWNTSHFGFFWFSAFWLLILSRFRLSAVLIVLIVEDDSFETKGVEKGSFCKRSDMFRIDSSNLISGISLQDDFAILLNFGYLSVWVSYCLNHE